MDNKKKAGVLESIIQVFGRMKKGAEEKEGVSDQYGVKERGVRAKHEVPVKDEVGGKKVSITVSHESDKDEDLEGDDDPIGGLPVEKPVKKTKKKAYKTLDDIE